MIYMRPILAFFILWFSVIARFHIVNVASFLLWDVWINGNGNKEFLKKLYLVCTIEVLIRSSQFMPLAYS